MGAPIEITQGWARWDLAPIDSTGRHTADELMVLRGSLAGVFLTKKVLQREPGSRLRTKFLTTAIRGGFGLTNRRDYSHLMRGLYTDDCEVSFSSDLPDVGAKSHRGPDAVAQSLRSFDDAYEDFVCQPREIIDPGGDVFAAAIETTGHGRTTAIPFSLMLGHLYTFRDGRICRQEMVREWPLAIERLKQIVAEQPAQSA